MPNGCSRHPGASESDTPECTARNASFQGSSGNEKIDGEPWAPDGAVLPSCTLARHLQAECGSPFVCTRVYSQACVYFAVLNQAEQHRSKGLPGPREDSMQRPAQVKPSGGGHGGGWELRPPWLHALPSWLSRAALLLPQSPWP